ncbi:MAG: Asp-tRNA(Asn)/Glu-tRNA(Gln) amidotransferase GatCAB subunit B, partial [bacterium]|nr:Asp-tRNA(Asn)/Glu-tRNA(Gln) amidotransferase GatCAB subunit B [bacterium]
LLVQLIDTEVISGKMAKTVFEEMFATGKSPKKIIEEKGLKQITNPEEIRKIANQVIDENVSQLKAYLDGNERLFGYFVGQAMKASNGNISPKVANDVIKEELNKRKPGK